MMSIHTYSFINNWSSIKAFCNSLYTSYNYGGRFFLIFLIFNFNIYKVSMKSNFGLDPWHILSSSQTPKPLHNCVFWFWPLCISDKMNIIYKTNNIVHNNNNNNNNTQPNPKLPKQVCLGRTTLSSPSTLVNYFWVQGLNLTILSHVYWHQSFTMLQWVEENNNVSILFTS
jgi:hypothetical protein